MRSLDKYKYELSAGLLTGAFGIVSFLVGLFANPNSDKPLNASDIFWAFFILIGVPLVVAFGSYFHAIRQNFLGVIMIAVGALISAFMILLFLVSLLGSVFGGGSLWLLIVIYLPSIMAIITAIVSIIEKIARTEPENSF